MDAQEHFERGKSYSSAMEWDEAINCFTEAIRLDPEMTKAWFKRGVAYAQRGDVAQALSDYDQVLLLDPENDMAHISRGILIEENSDLGQEKPPKKAERQEETIEEAEAIRNIGDFGKTGDSKGTKVFIAIGSVLILGALLFIAYQQDQSVALLDRLDQNDQRSIATLDHLDAFLNRKVLWEYKVIKVKSDLSRTGSQALSGFTVKVGDFENRQVWNDLGKAGWELVSSYVEHETAFPNFGNSEYVTGIRPNIRPSAVVFVFKRPRR